MQYIPPILARGTWLLSGCHESSLNIVPHAVSRSEWDDLIHDIYSSAIGRDVMSIDRDVTSVCRDEK